MIIRLLSNRYIVTFLLLLAMFAGLISQAQVNHKINLESCLKPFYHGVASGDPMPDKVIIWTRITPDTITTDPILVSWRMATDTGMSNVVKSGSLMTSNAVDYTVKVDVTGLNANTWYYYEFTVNGQNSPRGRTRTTPVGSAVDSLRFAIVSCANYEAGFFNAYNVLLNRADFDAVICLGDYIYEYETGGYAPNAAANRQWQPSNEIISLADYRQRYSTYHLDDDLRKLHQQFPFITIWDDHETANDAWMNGAENHQPNEGPFAVRKANAKQAYFEWLPIRVTGTTDPYQIFRTLRYGDLADFIMLDTRLHGRDEQAGTTGAVVNSPTRQLLGTDQFSWLGNRLDSSVCRWKILTQQVMIAPLKVFGQAVNGDQWDGYPAERDRVLNYIVSHNIKDVVAITGDIHSSWANDLPTSSYNGSTGGGSAGVEFVGPSVTSPGMSIPLGASAIMASNSHIKYAELSQHGFMILDINKTRTQSDWYYVSTIDQSSGSFSYGQSKYVNDQERFLRSAGSASLPRNSIYGVMAPLCPRVLSIPDAVHESTYPGLLNIYPNPAVDQLIFSFMDPAVTEVTVMIYDLNGRMVKEYKLTEKDLAGQNFLLNISDLKEGLYTGKLSYNHGSSHFKFVKQTQ
ncbi:MAG: alkaline phosphatase D family protein [Bacteroidetes bacterium]|nr:alkaline phosphatase D family protein [Bacteroidota bacterium]